MSNQYYDYATPDITQRYSERELSTLLTHCQTIESALRECKEYFDQRADAEYLPHSPAPIGNEEMRLLGIVQKALEHPKPSASSENAS